MNDSFFNTCLPFTLGEECPDPKNWSDPRNFSNDAHDPGGATQCGIIQAEYNRYRIAHGLVVQSVRFSTATEGDEIYYDGYWLPKCPGLKPGLNLSFFDSAVNFGPTGATHILQTTLGVSSDGIWGPITNRAVLAIADTQAAVRAFTKTRQATYQRLAGWPYFGKGWTRRTNEIGAYSLAMAATPTLKMRPAPQQIYVPSKKIMDPAMRAPIQTIMDIDSDVAD